MTLVPLSPGGAEPAPLNRAAAESLGERIQQQAATIAAATCELLLMVGEFEARGAVGWFTGLKSTAHWLSWSCSMARGTTREHVRAARALPSMPLTVKEFRAGRLSSPDSDPGRIAATTAGEGFHLAVCVDALCHSIIELAA